ncbi:DNA integration/recombination/inversion protein [Bacillus thuringiensis serovar israelensis ATCC 35646]|nr:DNA integration/recombination/inversion protein [Bacillus thuringiensis serovar israelensis ATCC 35646]
MKQGIHLEHFSHKDMFITLNRYSHVFGLECRRMLLKYVVKDH